MRTLTQTLRVESQPALSDRDYRSLVKVAFRDAVDLVFAEVERGGITPILDSLKVAARPDNLFGGLLITASVQVAEAGQ